MTKQELERENEELRKAVQPVEYYSVLGSEFIKYLDWRRKNG